MKKLITILLSAIVVVSCVESEPSAVRYVSSCMHGVYDLPYVDSISVIPYATKKEKLFNACKDGVRFAISMGYIAALDKCKAMFDPSVARDAIVSELVYNEQEACIIGARFKAK
jgi:hypothetical protein